MCRPNPGCGYLLTTVTYIAVRGWRRVVSKSSTHVRSAIEMHTMLQVLTECRNGTNIVQSNAEKGICGLSALLCGVYSSVTMGHLDGTGQRNLSSTAKSKIIGTSSMIDVGTSRPAVGCASGLRGAPTDIGYILLISLCA